MDRATLEKRFGLYEPNAQKFLKVPTPDLAWMAREAELLAAGEPEHHGEIARIYKTAAAAALKSKKKDVRVLREQLCEIVLIVLKKPANEPHMEHWLDRHLPAKPEEAPHSETPPWEEPSADTVASGDADVDTAESGEEDDTQLDLAAE